MATAPDTTPPTHDDAWETGALGRSEEHVRKSTAERVDSVDESLCLQMISMRLPKELLEQLKWIAKYHRVGYQPLMRDVLARWTRTEIMTIADQMQKELAAKNVIAESSHPKARRRA